ncbi:MAG: aspartate/glutamate racemase family protein [Tepidanaerobacteraceae bacterium]|nr:aspartate/glutamate racemase family protein [Tepidanaerobacteraceae bacterium]
MIYRVKPGQVSYGEPIGILLLDSCAPYIPGDVANATTYSFPVRFNRVPGLTVKRIFNHDMDLVDSIVNAALELKKDGVRAITGDCGFMAIYQKDLVRHLGLPIFMSSLLQVPFMERLIGQEDKIGIITANSKSLDQTVLGPCGADLGEKLIIRGLEDCCNFAAAFIDETGKLNKQEVEAEVLSVTKQMIAEVPEVKLLLFECSVLAPYGPAVQQATGLPIFDFITMINYVYTAVVKQSFNGYM